jgi:hypothetical protein
MQWLFTRKDTESLSLVSQGTVAETKKKFWSTKDPGQKPFTYTVSEAWCMQFSPQPLVAPILQPDILARGAGRSWQRHHGLGQGLPWHGDG